MAYETVLYDVQDQILTITLNRPEKLNAFTRAMVPELIDCFDRATPTTMCGRSSSPARGARSAPAPTSRRASTVPRGVDLRRRMRTAYLIGAMTRCATAAAG